MIITAVPGLRFSARLTALFGTLFLTACVSTVQVPRSTDWEQHQRDVSALGDWQLAGRLNVRQNRQSETVQINWEQHDPAFDLRLSGSFGLGAVLVYGTPSQVTVEKSGEAAVSLPGLNALTREYFGYEFPTAQLLYWVRGIPAPGRTDSLTLNAENLLGSLTQTDAAGQQWLLEFDRYETGISPSLPGRIKVNSKGLQLTFLINNWQFPAAQVTP